MTPPTGNLNAGHYPFPWLLVEGGGSRTWVAVVGDRDAQLSGLSTNVTTGSQSSARLRLRKLLGSVLAAAGVQAGDVRLAFAAHGAAATQQAAERFADVCAEVLAGLGVRADLIVTSDMVPVVTSGDADRVVAAIAGTGTVYVAHRELTYWARASGADYLLSDEGGGFDLAVHGLRAAIRASDGRGPATGLVASARQWAAAPDDVRLSDALYNHVYVARPRSLVAGFAPSVLHAAQEGDDVALELVEAAAEEFLMGVRAVTEQVGIARDSPAVILSGSLATVESPLRRAILKRVREQLSPAAITDYQPENLAAKVTGVVRLLRDGGAHIAGLRAVLPVTIRRVT